MKGRTKTTLAAIAASTTIVLRATPSSNDVQSVTQDWYSGNYSNVYELAQQRLAANTNDLVGAYLMMEYDTCFSSIEAASNSIMRLVRISDTVTLPAYTNHYNHMRSGWIWYANEFLPSRTPAQRELNYQKSLQPGNEMSSDFLLEILDEGGLW